MDRDRALVSKDRPRCFTSRDITIFLGQPSAGTNKRMWFQLFIHLSSLKWYQRQSLSTDIAFMPVLEADKSISLSRVESFLEGIPESSSWSWRSPKKQHTWDLLSFSPPLEPKETFMLPARPFLFSWSTCCFKSSVSNPAVSELHSKWLSGSQHRDAGSQRAPETPPKSQLPFSSSGHCWWFCLEWRPGQPALWQCPWRPRHSWEPRWSRSAGERSSCRL